RLRLHHHRRGDRRAPGHQRGVWLPDRLGVVQLFHAAALRAHRHHARHRSDRQQPVQPPGAALGAMMRATTTFPNRRHLPLAIQLGTIALFLLIWELSVGRGWVDSLFLASPTDTFASLAGTMMLALPHLTATMTTFLVAFVLGVGGAVLLGLALN